MPPEDMTRKFQPISAYAKPALPTDETLQRIIARALATARGGDDDAPLIARKRLSRAAKDMLDTLAAGPASGAVAREMQASYAEWLDNGDPDHTLRLVVLPPCDTDNLVRGWARTNGLEIIEAPARSALQDSDTDTLLGPLKSGTARDPALVIPELERWFLRDAACLGPARALLDAIATSRRKIMMGSNSWAYGFLKTCFQADLVLPRPHGFAAFDAARLHAWFATLPQKDTLLRLSATGAPVFEGDTPSDYFVKLAALSRGIPWVAWHLWRASIRDLPEDDLQEDPADDSLTGDALAKNGLAGDGVFWVTDPPEFSLPSGYEPAALMVLHGLLLHGGLPRDLLDRILPERDNLRIIDALLTAGILRESAGELFCTATAYPQVHEALRDAGYSMDGF